MDLNSHFGVRIDRCPVFFENTLLSFGMATSTIQKPKTWELWGLFLNSQFYFIGLSLSWSRMDLEFLFSLYPFLIRYTPVCLLCFICSFVFENAQGHLKGVAGTACKWSKGHAIFSTWRVKCPSDASVKQHKDAFVARADKLGIGLLSI